MDEHLVTVKVTIVSQQINDRRHLEASPYSFLSYCPQKSTMALS